uniref:Uncharacterized protein n=1 Tax=Glossina pallidipes TaxID=7398 RepID=A0A1A9Z0P9_GLOPL
MCMVNLNIWITSTVSVTPLSGEFAMRTRVIHDMKIPGDWGLEIGLLSEIYRNYSPNHICQVEIADNYDHKHQPLAEEDGSGVLKRMSNDIIQSLYRKLATMGVSLTSDSFRVLKATYYRNALDILEFYHHDAIINGLSFDQYSEEAAVELFMQCILDDRQAFIERPNDKPFIPIWSRVQSAFPDIMQRIYDAVEEDNKGNGDGASRSGKSAEVVVAALGEGPNEKGASNALPMNRVLHQMSALAERIVSGRGETSSIALSDETRRLPRQEPEDAGRDLLMQALARENMQRAWKRLKANKGAAGVDGLSIAQTGQHLKYAWPTIRQQVMIGTHRPQPARRVGIPKPDGSERELGIPTVIFRLQVNDAG